MREPEQVPVEAEWGQRKIQKGLEVRPTSRCSASWGHFGRRQENFSFKKCVML